MAAFVVFRDRRVKGGVPHRPSMRIVNFDDTVPVSRGFHAISASAAQRPVHTLFIICHGMAGGDFAGQVSTTDDAGGLGLLLGSDRVTHMNVADWIVIGGKVKNIVIYSCMAAQSKPGTEGTRSDGRYLMRALALHTRATIYASDTSQYAAYNEYGGFNFGSWEGNLFRFPPDGFSCQAVQRAPIEYNDVLAGRYA